MSTFGVIILLIIFGALQVRCYQNGKTKKIKYIPFIIGVVGELIGLAMYYGSYVLYLLKMDSQSVLSENQYFALTICVLFALCLIGSLLGVILAKFGKSKKLFYFLPFVLAIIVYLTMAFLGFGMISITELIWILLFCVSGFLLSMEKVWGGVLGMIPGFIFMWMSTDYTGQVINIELPLGILIVGFYVGCGVGIFCRKRKIVQK